MSGTGGYPPAESGFYALGDGKAERLKAQRTDLSGFVRFYLEMFFTFREVHFNRKTSINLFSYKPS